MVESQGPRHAVESGILISRHTNGAEADSLYHAVAPAKRSPGLKHGFTHEVFPEISLSQAAQEKVSDQA